MSPEQAAGESHIDARSDIYSLAAMMYEMLAGEPPYTGRTAQVILTKRLTEPVPSVRRIRDKVPESIDATIQQALAPVPADRYATASEFTSALTTLVVSEPKETVRWKRWAAAGVAATFVTAIGVGLALGNLGGRDTVDESVRRIAVLPFDNFSADTESSYIANADDDGDEPHASDRLALNTIGLAWRYYPPTRTGTRLPVVVPSPSWPTALFPQQ